MAMIDLSTTYMGLKLKNPIVPSASPLAADLDGIRRLEDAGAAAVTLPSLFEEQIEMEAEQLAHFMEDGTYINPEAPTHFPPLTEFRRGPKEYVEHIRKASQAVSIPVIASLNGISPGGWTGYARQFQDAGAAAIELNVYYVDTDPGLTSAEVEQRYVDTLKQVKEAVTIPVAIKIGPFLSALPNMAVQLDAAGANGLVLFNRFYQPDLDIETLDVCPHLVLSSSDEMRLPLRWVAILYGRIKASLALTTGVHTPEDVLKALMAGADVANVCSVLLKGGTGKIGELLRGVTTWMEEHEYSSLEEMKGSLSQRSCPDPAAFERANYMKVLKSYA
jgi:dihydroorotate dehydrogenase (fumarate)